MTPGLSTPMRRRSWPTAGILGAVILAAGCGGSPSPPAVAPPALGSLAGAGAAHRFFEVYEPAPPVRGTMITLHGGGWRDRPGDARRIMGGPAVTLQQAHWRVVNISYRQPTGYGTSSPDPRPMLRDVVAFYDQVRRAFPGPVCADGASAGGHLAAMLAVERPSLTCALIAAAPLDLPSLLTRTSPLGRTLITDAFGTRSATLRAWSPARVWNRGTDHTRVFLTDADNDPLIPPQQARAFTAAAHGTPATTLAGASGADEAPFVHAPVTREALLRAITAQARWLDAVVPLRATPAPAAGPSAVACVPARRNTADGARLLLAGSAWRQAASPDRLLAATAACGASPARQDAGLSVWAFPRDGAVARAGSSSTLAYRSSRPLRRVDASLRGFLARPRDWSVGLFASPRAAGPAAIPVATCDLGVCRGLRLVPGAGGALITVPAGGRSPDTTATPPVHRFALPPGTRQIAWRLTCVAAAGCRLDGIGAGRRQRDPLGHPAIFSVYQVRVR